MTFHMHATCFIFALILLLGNSIYTHAQCNRSAPLQLQSLHIFHVEERSQRGVVECVALVKADGDLIATLHLMNAQLHIRDSTIRRTVHAGEAVQLRWVTDFPAVYAGRLGEVNVLITPYNAADRARFVEGSIYSLYVVIADGRVSYSSSRPTTAMIVAPRGVVAPAGKRDHPRTLQSAPTTIHVNITGRVTAQDGSHIPHGVSNVRIYFDWDADEGAGTFQAPAYDGPGDTAQYAIADADGNFSFTRQATAENESWVWDVHRIRLYATAWNDAAYIESWGKNAVFTDQQLVAITITPVAPDFIDM
ncbi:MAG: hypothetical protein JST22_12450 [Bacteroidetes bacterium]|nr:hypothetical protein [Bacteroidota bacterium]